MPLPIEYYSEQQLDELAVLTVKGAIFTGYHLAVMEKESGALRTRQLLRSIFLPFTWLTPEEQQEMAALQPMAWEYMSQSAGQVSGYPGFISWHLMSKEQAERFLNKIKALAATPPDERN